MTNIIEFKGKQERIFEGSIIETRIVAVYQLLDEDEFFAFINGDEIDHDLTDPLITRMHSQDGWAIGLRCHGKNSVILQCMKSGKVKMYQSLDEANMILADQGLGGPRIYNLPINSKTFD